MSMCTIIQNENISRRKDAFNSELSKRRKIFNNLSYKKSTQAIKK